MANMILSLDQSLPTLNDIITASKQVRRGKHYFSNYIPLKKKWTELIAAELVAQDCVPETPYEKISLYSVWTESAKKRDPDNVCAGGRKFLLDAMVKAKIIKDDTRDHVIEFRDIFPVSKARKVATQIHEVV